mmetsp:Transcript_25565/g.73463  ORF Transcript_25565/g.73463 Transcript_25565/m.73463 type:complete len:591 (-) Transcript_25565:66-1838(-)
MRAGFDVVFWSHSDFRAYAEPYGLAYRAINPSSKLINERLAGADPKDAERNRLNLFWSRYCLSYMSKQPVGGVAFCDDIPKDMVLADMGGAWSVVESLVGDSTRKEDHATAQRLQEQCQAMKAMIEEELAKAPEVTQEAAQGPPATDAKEAIPSREWPFERDSREWTLAEEVANTDFTDFSQMFRFGELVSRSGAFASDRDAVEGMKQELDHSPPDAVMGNALLTSMAFNIAKRCNVPMFYLSVASMGVRLDDLDAPWVTDEAWPLLQALNPYEFSQYSSLQEARAKHKFDDSAERSREGFALAQAAEEVLLKPIFGTTAIRDMGLEEWHKRMNQGALVGFMSAVCSDAFLRWMGERTKKEIKDNVYCGYWMFAEEDEERGFGDGFGDARLRQRVESFLDAGPKPAYIGFGSCFCMEKGRGRHWMVAQAAAAIQASGMRGIILEGWAGLTLDLLRETVGEEHSSYVHARDNILFVPAVSQRWLFPKCSVLVIHGGVGTLGAAWISGVPTIVWPVWMDQPANAQLHTLLGAGTALPSVAVSDAQLVGQAIKKAAESKEASVAARTIQFSMLKDKGVQKVVEHLEKVLVHEA